MICLSYTLFNSAQQGSRKAPGQWRKHKALSLIRELNAYCLHFYSATFLSFYLKRPPTAHNEGFSVLNPKKKKKNGFHIERKTWNQTANPTERSSIIIPCGAGKRNGFKGTGRLGLRFFGVAWKWGLALRCQVAQVDSSKPIHNRKHVVWL